MKIIRYCLLAILLFSLSSCSDFLDREPVDFLSPNSIKSEDDMNYALTGIYNALYYPYNYPHPGATDYFTDDICNNDGSDLLNCWTFEMSPFDNGSVCQKKWEGRYMGILRTNTLLSRLDDVSATDASKALVRAQALVLRAYFYSDLIEYFGDVPFRTESEPTGVVISPRVDKNIILDKIIENIDTALALDALPLAYSASDKGKITLGAAYAIKGKILLNNKKYTEAASALREVVATGKYSLYSDIRAMVSDGASESDNKEYIFETCYMAGQPKILSNPFWSIAIAQRSSINYDLIEQYNMANGLPITNPDSGFDEHNPFEGRDPRLLAFFLEEYPNNVGDIDSGWKSNKFIEPFEDTELVHYNGAMNFPIIRYADVLLMLAEALVQTGSYDYSEVTGLIDQVRQRPSVKMPKVADIEGAGGKTLTVDELMEVIKHERRVELPMEGVRYSDLKRWGITAELLEKPLYAMKVTTENDVKSYEKIVLFSRDAHVDRFTLWPIPIIEIKSNPMEQNPGYENL